MALSDIVGREIARDNIRREALGDITSATFDTLSGVASNGLTGTSPLAWARQIKGLYRSVDHVVVEPNGRVRAMHHGGQPFTLGWVRVHRATTTTTEEA